MNEPIEYFSNNLKSVEEDELLIAIDKLNAHMKNKNYFKPYTFSVHNGAVIKEDFSSKNKRQSYFFQCKLEECNFFEASFAGSVFVECEFINCKLDFSKFPSCDFRNCTITFSGIEKKEVNSANFSKSVFNGCRFNNIFFNSANFGESIFDKGKIINNKWRSVVVENMIIKNSILENMRFASQNFDFLTIENITTLNTVFPFPALPNIINGLTYLYNTHDNIRFTSYDGKFNRIGREEYISLIEYFKTYYTYTKEYFPLANILISQECLQDAIHVTCLGIIQSIKLKNFRIIYQFCKLVQINPKFSIQYKKRLYQQIQLEINKENLSTEDYEFLNIYLGKIKDALLSSTTQPHLILDLKSNIDSTENNKISILIQQIEMLITLCMEKNEEHFIEIRHNSLENFIIQISSDPERLIIFLAAFFTCIGYSCQFVSFFINKTKYLISNKKNLKSSKNDSEKQNIEIKSAKHILENNDIKIMNVNYNIFNASNIDPEIQSGYVNIND